MVARTAMNAPWPRTACLLVLLGLAAPGCSGDKRSGGDDAAGTMCQACTPGAYACAGNALLRCLDDGSGYEVTPCLDTQVCDATQRQCVPSQCPSPGFRKCLDDHTLQTCQDGELTAQPCNAQETCVDGACVPAACADGVQRCGATALLACVGGAWQATPCASGTACLPKEGGDAACAPTACTPGAPFCADLDDQPGAETSVVCNAWGTAGDPSTAQDCSALGAACVDGLCRCLAEAGAADAGSGGDAAPADAGGSGGTTPPADAVVSDGFVHVEPDTTPLKPPDVASATIDGENVEFDSYTTAAMTNMSEDGVLGTLQIVLASGVRVVELEVRPVKLGYTGTVDSEAGGDITGFIGYNDGTAPQGVDFTYGAGTSDKGQAFAGSYHIEITRNDGPGGRVEGTFSGVLVAAQGDGQVVIENGTFAINHD